MFLVGQNFVPNPWVVWIFNPSVKHSLLAPRRAFSPKELFEALLRRTRSFGVKKDHILRDSLKEIYDKKRLRRAKHFLLRTTSFEVPSPKELFERRRNTTFGVPSSKEHNLRSKCEAFLAPHRRSEFLWKKRCLSQHRRSESLLRAAHNLRSEKKRFL